MGIDESPSLYLESTPRLVHQRNKHGSLQATMPLCPDFNRLMDDLTTLSSDGFMVY
jgi:hypothetical protein